MAFELQPLALSISAEEFRQRIDRLLNSEAQRFNRLWLYYRNPMSARTMDRDEQGSDRPYRQAQEWGLPSRVTGVRSSSQNLLTQAVDGVARKEVVIENDIAWRLDAMIDFLFGKPFTLKSTVAEPNRAAQIQTLLNDIFDFNGGLSMLQQLGLIGSINGFVDVLVKLDAVQVASIFEIQKQNKIQDEPAPDAALASAGNAIGDETDALLPPPAEFAPSEDSSALSAESSQTHPTPSPDALRLDASIVSTPAPIAPLATIARAIRLEIIEPARALPVLSETDWRDVQAYVQVYAIRKRTQNRATQKAARWFSRVLPQVASSKNANLDSSENQNTIVTEILTPEKWQRYENESLVAQGDNSLGELPLVHIQNLAIPFEYAGKSDVELLMPLQDELNTRLSDRANRITMQSFKMYLGKGIEDFTNLPVAPGRMWVTDNDQADVIEFGGDPSSPSEDKHIQELRDALDKASSVTPIAAGTVRDKIGNLTSAAALRVTMMALLAKNDRKRSAYGQAISRMCELSLAWLDKAGLFATSPDERKVTIDWPDVLPDLK